MCRDSIEVTQKSRSHTHTPSSLVIPLTLRPVWLSVHFRIHPSVHPLPFISLSLSLPLCIHLTNSPYSEKRIVSILFLSPFIPLPLSLSSSLFPYPIREETAITYVLRCLKVNSSPGVWWKADCTRFSTSLSSYSIYFLS